MHALTATQALVLRVDVTDFAGEQGYAIYDTFSVGDASTQYTLTANNYVEGNIGRLIIITINIVIMMVMRMMITVTMMMRKIIITIIIIIIIIIIIYSLNRYERYPHSAVHIYMVFRVGRRVV